MMTQTDQYFSLVHNTHNNHRHHKQYPHTSRVLVADRVVSDNVQSWNVITNSYGVTKRDWYWEL